MENLEALGKGDLPRKLYKIVIPNSWRSRILHDFQNMNIAPDYLFPGLDGFARSLKLNFSMLKNSDVSQEVVRLQQKYGFDIPV